MFYLQGICISTFIIFFHSFYYTQCKLEANNIFDQEITINEGGGEKDFPSHSNVKLLPLKTRLELLRSIDVNEMDITLERGVNSRNKAITHLRPNKEAECSNPPLHCNSNHKYRNINGTCNNINRPYIGSSVQPYIRLLPAEYNDGVSEPRGGGGLNSSLPNARLVSTTVHGDINKTATYITNLVPVFGLFLHHDMSYTPEKGQNCCSGDPNTECFSIPIYKNDTFYSRYGLTCMNFTRSTAYCSPVNGIREQFNANTAFLDLSSIYGSDSERLGYVREFQRGRLRVNKEAPNLLPTVAEVEEEFNVKIDIRGEFFAGDGRLNEQPALTALYMLFLREHNRIAEEIFKRKPSWSDEIIFQETRRIVIAEYQTIIYKEYLPIVLGNERMSYFKLWHNPPSRYDDAVDVSISNVFATAAHHFEATLFVGTSQLFKGRTPVGSYRIRDAVFDSETIKQNGGKGYDLVLNGLIQQKAQFYDQYVTEDFTNFFLKNKAKSFGADLLAIIIQWGRDHGIPSYSKFARFCSGGARPPLTNWKNRPAEIRPDVWKLYSELYGSPGDIDLYTAGISEFPNSGAVTGPVFACLLGLQYNRVKYGDRFFSTHVNQIGSFTEIQMRNILSRRLGDIICENSNITSTTNNVFTTPTPCGTRNPWIPCNAIRPRLNFDIFV